MYCQSVLNSSHVYDEIETSKNKTDAEFLTSSNKKVSPVLLFFDKSHTAITLIHLSKDHYEKSQIYVKLWH